MANPMNFVHPDFIWASKYALTNFFIQIYILHIYIFFYLNKIDIKINLLIIL